MQLYWGSISYSQAKYVKVLLGALHVQAKRESEDRKKNEFVSILVSEETKEENKRKKKEANFIPLFS
jgi:hypothetical protein